MFLALAGAGGLWAQEQEFTFALPEIEGRISLGVFDTGGKLVRTLKVGATEKDFVIGLNGLISKWDAKDDAGAALPAGKYFIRGYVVGNEVKPEGVAFHFNDWVVDEDSPAIRWLEDFDRLPDGRIVALGELQGGEPPIVFAYQEDAGMLWQHRLKDFPTDMVLNVPMPAPMKSEPRGGIGGITVPAQQRSPEATRPMLAVSEDYAAVLAGYQFFLLDGKSGQPLKQSSISGASPRYFTAEGRDLFVGSAEGIATIGLPDLIGVGTRKTPLIFDTLSVGDGKMIAGSREKSGVWIGEKNAWQTLAIPASVSCLDFGNNNTFWAVGKSSEGAMAFVGQFAANGEFLRSYRGDLEPKLVRAGRLVEEIAVLEESATTQRLVVLRMGEKSGWEITFEKMIERCENFGLIDGKLVADAGPTPPPNEAQLELSTGGLSPSAPKLTLRADPEADGLWLKTKEGLKILRVTEHAGLDRVALQKTPEALQIYAGNGAVVAEYAVGGVSQIAEIDAGEIDLP